LNLNKKSLFVISGIPITMIFLAIMQPDFFNIVVILVLAMTIMILLLSIIHWGIFDKSNNLGISADKYWSKRDDSSSYTHGSS
jgi:hypothetical protein